MAKKFTVRRVMGHSGEGVTESGVPADALMALPAATDGEGGAGIGPMGVGKVVAAALTPAQRIAIERLSVGETVVDAARAAGVTRMTLHRWLKQDAEFVAAYNAWQEETLASARGRLLALADTAVTTVANAMRNGDARAAMAVLKAM